MADLTLRQALERPLTNAEVDSNFENLNGEKLERTNNLSELTSTAEARSNLELGSAALRDAQEIDDAEILALVGI
mgnify:CR=1 FL=1|jgi:hypothetical protein